MRSPRRDRIDALFDEALERPADERAAWLNSECVAEPDVLAEVQALLRAHERAEGILEEDVAALGAALLAERMATPDTGSIEFGKVYERIGPYRIVGEIGRGGMGVVYIGERDDGQFRMRVAIKIIGGGPESFELRSRFEAERQILASLNHPCIAKLLDGGVTTDGRPYLVMEYIDGRPIDRFCDDERLSVDERLQLFAQVARAVHHAHGRLIVHRDLKPSNILVTESGVPKLLDFGIAKILDPARFGHTAAPHTRTGLRMMTPEYASPEQIRGEPATTSNDVYGLGIVLYELLTGERPFPTKGRTPLEGEQLILDTPAPRPSTIIGKQMRRGSRASQEVVGVDHVADARRTTAERLERRLRGDLDRIVTMTLRKGAERRYSSALELAEDVERYLAGRPVAAQGDSFAYRTRKFLWRHRWSASAAALVLLSLIAGLIGVSWQASVARSERDRASAEALKAERVASMMKDIFRLSDPNEALGDTITARQILDQSTLRLEREFGDQPAVQASLLSEVARVYANLGILSRAESLVREALRLRERLFGLESPEVSESLGQLADVMAATGERGQAATLYTRAIAIRARQNNTLDTLIAQYRASLAWELRALGQHDSAAALFERALETQRAAWGDDRPEVATTMLGLASSYHDVGAFDQAETLFERALARQDTGTARAHPLAATALLNVGMIRRIRQQYQGSEPLIVNALAMRRALYEEDHPAVLEALDQWGSLLYALGRYAEAQQVVSDALDRVTMTLGGDHPTAIGLRESLAAVLAELGRYSASAAQYDSLLAIKNRLYATDHPSIVFTLVMSGDALLEGGRFDDARQRFLASQAMSERVSGAQSMYRILSLQGLARIAIARRQLADAESMIDEATALADTLLRPDHRYVLNLQRARAALLLARNRGEEAARVLQDIGAKETQIMVGPHPVRGRTAQLHAEVLLARGDTAGAVTSLTQASTHYAGLPRNHPRVRQVETTLAALR